MKATARTKTWCHALVASVALCAVGAWADCYTYNTAGGTADLGSETQIDSTDRLLVRKGTVNTDSRSLQFMDNLRYGAIYNRTLSGDGSTYQPFYVEPELASGLAFQDVRFYTKILTSAEARAYAAEFPVSEQAKTPGFTILIR